MASTSKSCKYLRQWSKADCVEWMKSLGSDYLFYGQAFDFNDVNGKILQQFTKSDLSKLGIRDHKEQKFIMEQLRKLIQQNEQTMQQQQSREIRADAPAKSLTLFPQFREEYKLLDRIAGAPVTGKLHGLGFDTAHPFVDVDSKSENFFVGMLHKAFTDHLPITIRPDDIWLTVLQGLAIHVNQNAKELQPRIMKTANKASIVALDSGLKYGDLDNPWVDNFRGFRNQIEHFTVPGTSDLLAMGFSTSTTTTTMTGQCAIFDVVSSYFSYGSEDMSPGGGVAEVYLCGTVKDWKSLRAKVELLRAFQLDWWLENLIPICDQFVTLSQHLTQNGGDDKPLNEASKNFWKSIYRYDTESGGPVVSGWVNALFPYVTTEEGKQTKFVRNRAVDWNDRKRYNEDLATLAKIRAMTEAESKVESKVSTDGPAPAAAAAASKEDDGEGKVGDLPQFMISEDVLGSSEEVSEVLDTHGVKAHVEQVSGVYRAECADKASFEIMKRLAEVKQTWGTVKFLDEYQDVSTGEMLREREDAERRVRSFESYEHQFYLTGCLPGSFPPGYTSAPVRWRHRGRNVQVRMTEGFFACAQNPETFALEPSAGWCVVEGKFTLMNQRGDDDDMF